MILASAQTNPKRGDIASNLTDHYKMIELAADNQVDLIVFPEMSITGYEREKALDLAFTEKDTRLDTLRQLSVNKKMILVVGAPVLIKDDLYIGAFILKPDHSISIYTKQYLHPGEEAFFKSSFDYQPNIKIGDVQLSLAICADIDHPQHAQQASENGTGIYLASIFFSPNGIPTAYQSLSEDAVRYKMEVLMANYCGQSWGCDAGGQSAFWDQNGQLIANLTDAEPALLIVERTDQNWTGKIIKCE